MRSGRLAACLVTLALLAACASAGSSATLRVSGSTTVNPIVADAAEVLRDQGLEITVDTQGGSAGGISQLGLGQIDVGMSSKPVTDEDRARFPQVDFVATAVGVDAIAVAVRREVLEGGLSGLTRDQARALFEGRISNWSELGGPDLGVFVYDKEPGRGTREVFDAYLYGPGAEAQPPPDSDRFAIVGGNEEGRTKASSTPGAVTILSVAFVEDSTTLVALPLDGVAPSAANLASGRYPLVRPLFLLTNGEPEGDAATLIDFVLSVQGQDLLAREGFLTLAQLENG